MLLDAETRSDGESASGAELGMRDDTRVRQVARIHHRLVRPPDRVRSGDGRPGSSRECTTPGGELPRPCVAGSGRAEIPSARRKRTENVGRSLGCADEWSVNDFDGHHRAAVPRCRGIDSRRGRIERCAASRSGSRNQREFVDSSLTSCDGGGGAPKPPSQARLVDAAPRPAVEAVGVQTKPATTETPTACPAQWSLALRRKKETRKGKGKKQRRQSEEGRTIRMNSNNDPERGCVADVTREDTLPEDGFHMGRSKSVLGGQQGSGNPWRVHDAALQSQQKAVENYGKMLSSPAGRWLRWRLHEVRSIVLYCHCRESQPCHGDVIVRAFAEAKSEEEQRGGALPRLERLSLCEVGWALKSHLCLSPRRRGLAMQEMLNRCSTFWRREEVRDLLPFPVPRAHQSRDGTVHDCAHGQPVSPELIHEAAVDVWVFLLKWSLNWQFAGRDAGGSARPAFSPTNTNSGAAGSPPAIEAVSWRLRSRPPSCLVRCSKTTSVDCTGEEIKQPEPTTWAQIAPALPVGRADGSSASR